MKTKTLIPFNKNLINSAYFIDHDNYLSQSDNIFIMDNHRLALWCWWNQISENKLYSFIHIDAHWDCSPTFLPYFLKHKKKLKTLSLEEFRNYNIKTTNGNTRLFRWDNYIPMFLEKNKKIVYKISSVWQNEDSRNKTHFNEKILKIEHLSFLIRNYNRKEKIIFNLDMDYFFKRKGDYYSLRFSKSEILNFFEALHFCYKRKNIKVLTIALSPECCGSWKNSNKILKLFNKKFNIKFNIHDNPVISNTT